MEDHNNFLDSDGDEDIGCEKDQKLESTKGEMEEAREENKRLKFSLERLVNDYQSLQTNFLDILQQDEPEDATKAKGTITTSHELENKENHELVTLSLGLSSKYKPTKDEDMDKRLAHGLLDLNFDPMTQVEAANNSNTESSFGEEGKEEPTEMWPPSKVLKTMKFGDKSEASQHTHLKKARVSIRARCDTQTMNDGCQWRKYGQKRAKGNPCPRAYYRCTVSPSCPVKKQVQRCAEDMSILITTYEGTHNHPLPMSATAIASTTSVAASMLQSPSLTSQAHTPNSLDFSIYQISRPHQFNFPNSFISTLNSHPIITLDLTAPPTSSNSQNFTSNLPYMPNYCSTNLNFSSGFSPLQSSMPHSHSPWSSYSGYFNSLAQNRNQGGCLLNTGKQLCQGHPYQTSYMSNHGISPVVAATKDNPKFESALATALTTCVGNAVGGGRLRENHVVKSAELNLKLSSKNG